MVDKPSGRQAKEHSAEARAHTSQAPNRGYGILGKQIAWDRKYVRQRPAIAERRRRYEGDGKR